MRATIAGAAAFAVAALLAAAAPTLPLELPALALLGAASVLFAASINTGLQLAAEPRDARPRDGALLDRLPRLDADRRADRGLARARRSRRGLR